MGNDKDVVEFSYPVIFLPSIAIPLVQAPATVAQEIGCKRRQITNLAAPKVGGATRHIGGCRIPKLLGMKLEYVAKFCIKNEHEPEREFQRW